MTTNKYPLGVFIGRFQPFHDGHAAIIRQALQQVQSLLILCGSADGPRNLKNPFTFAERETMIRAALPEDAPRLLFAPLRDTPYDNPAWIVQVQETVTRIAAECGCAFQNIVLVGHKKDASSFYLDYFPHWKKLWMENVAGISATPIRERYLRLGDDDAAALPYMSAPVCRWLEDFRRSDAYRALHAERRMIDDTRQSWAGSPYPPVFVTVDAMVVHRDHILLIERGNHPGKGLLAMPGGYLEQDDTLLQSCLRELVEETGLIVEEKLWESAFLRHRGCYDAPERSALGRVITHVFYFRLPADAPRPTISAGDDAAKAFWLPCAQLSPARMHDDHYHIIRDILRQTGDGVVGMGDKPD